MTVALMNTVIAAIDYAPPPPITSIFTAAQLTLWPTLTADQLIPAVQTAPYTLNTVDFVIREYQLAFGGVPDLGGAAYWTHALADGTQTDASLSLAFASSTQFFDTYHISATTPMNSDALAFTYVEALYKNAFNETLGSTDPGVMYWANSNLTASQVLQAFVVSPQFVQLTATPITVFQTDQVNAAEGIGTVPPAGTSLFSLPLAAFTLTIGVDAGAGFTANTAGAVFNALPGSNPPLGVTNTLNAGDNLQDTVGDGTLNYTAVNNPFGLVNSPFAQAVTMNGISTANITSLTTFATAGFAGDITGLTKVTASTANPGNLILLGTAGDGLNTALTDITLKSSQDFTAWMTAAAFGAGTDTATVHLTGVDRDGQPHGDHGHHRLRVTDRRQRR